MVRATRSQLRTRKAHPPPGHAAGFPAQASGSRLELFRKRHSIVSMPASSRGVAPCRSLSLGVRHCGRRPFRATEPRLYYSPTFWQLVPEPKGACATSTPTLGPSRSRVYPGTCLPTASAAGGIESPQAPLLAPPSLSKVGHYGEHMMVRPRPQGRYGSFRLDVGEAFALAPFLVGIACTVKIGQERGCVSSRRGLPESAARGAGRALPLKNPTYLVYSLAN